MRGAFVSEAAARAAAKGFDLDEGRLMPELFELFKTTFRGVHGVSQAPGTGSTQRTGRLRKRAAEHARSVQDATLRLDDEAEES